MTNLEVDPQEVVCTESAGEGSELLAPREQDRGGHSER